MAWMMTSTALVLFMSVPALALFYGGLVREKNMLSVLMQVFVGFSLITVLWCVYGYSLAFTEGPNPFIGGFSRLFLKGTFDPLLNGVVNPAGGTFSMAATFDKGTPLNELVYVGFQATFAAITCCLILGSLVERVKFSAALIFMVIWFTFRHVTESAALISTNPTGAVKQGSVGRPVPGTEIEIRDGDGRPLPSGEPGEVCARSPGIMQGYWRAPEATGETLRDGWLHTGDIGYLDDEGYLYIVDRKKDLIIRGGFNVYPRDVEDALVKHPAVQMAAVVGRPSELHGEEVVAFVSLAADAQLTGDVLIAWAREHIGGYKYPREVHVVDTIPLTPVGKIDRKAVRARLATPPSVHEQVG